MSEAQSKLAAVNLDDAIAKALENVKKHPTDTTARIYLFELSLFSGDLDRAERQVDVIGKQDANALIGSVIFKQNMKAERDRLSVFEEGLIPECLMPPPKYVESLLPAISLVKEGKYGDAQKVVDNVEENRPAFTCKVNGKASSDIRDFNDLTMCVFEAIVQDSYSWLPFEQVSSVKLFEAKSLRDNFWRQAEVEMLNGTKGEMFIPCLYSGTYKSKDEAVRLGKATDWKDIDEEIFIGEGMRVFQTEDSNIPFTDIQTIEFIHE